MVGCETPLPPPEECEEFPFDGSVDVPDRAEPRDRGARKSDFERPDSRRRDQQRARPERCKAEPGRAAKGAAVVEDEYGRGGGSAPEEDGLCFSGVHHLRCFKGETLGRGNVLHVPP